MNLSRCFLLSIIFLLAGCSLPVPDGGSGPAPVGGTAPSRTPLPRAQGTQLPTSTPFQPVFPTATPTPSPTPAAITLWAPDELLPALSLSGTPLTLADDSKNASLRLEAGGDHPLSRWVFALVAPFPEISDQVSLSEVQAAWNGQGPELWVSEGTMRALRALWGPPSPAGVRSAAPESLLESALERHPAWAIIPFEALEPRWKVLAVDGQSPVHKDFDLEAYPLVVPFSLAGDPALVEAVQGLYGPDSQAPLLPPVNRDPERLTTLVMTGVTALVRATAWTMEQQGVEYPARDIGGWLREADITHISNEVPFAHDCPFPNAAQQGVVFCSDPRYIALLEAVGTDVVELTGDHFADWGTQAMLYTLELYDERNWPYYGGGASFEQGRQAVLLEHNGNKFAFIGCNRKGGSFAQASATNPGAVRCDFPWMEAEIGRLSAQGYLVIATFQHFEYYSYAVPPGMKDDFRRLADAGAVIVSGSQAHHPHQFEFWGGALLHYGLGNLFFDQYGLSPGTEQAFIDRHVFYDGKYISTELLTIQFVDYARPRPMTVPEREALLQSVFAASGW